MKKLLAFISVLALMIFISPLVSAEYTEWPEWDSMSNTGKYYAFYQAVTSNNSAVGDPSKIPTYDEFIKDPQIQINIDRFGRDYIRYDNSKSAFIVPTFEDENSPANSFIMRNAESYGLCDFGQGYYNGPKQAVSNSYKDTFYNSGVNGGNGGTFDLGNGYTLVCTADFINNDTYWTGFSLYYNGEYTYTTIRFSEYYESNIKDNWSNVPMFRSWRNDRFYISSNNGNKYLNYTGVLGNHSYDITAWANSIPSGMTENDVKPQYIDPTSSLPNFQPVNGSNQDEVNEQIQEQLNDNNNWLEKIYNEEVAIHSTLKSFFSPLSGLLGCGRNIESICNSILDKLDNLTVKIKNSDGTDINFGDLELGDFDVDIDFDVVYNVTGITKITTPNDLTKNFGSYKETLESKLGMQNARQTANNFSQALFGAHIFNNNGTINTNYSPSNVVQKPHLYFTFMNVTYDLFAGINFTQDQLSSFKDVVSFFLLLGTFMAVFRYIPTIIGNVTTLEVRSEMVDQALEQQSYDTLFYYAPFMKDIKSYQEGSMRSRGRWI